MTVKTEICQVQGCGRDAISRGYCRLHYIQFWRQIQVRKNVGSERLLNRVKEAMIRDRVENRGGYYLKKVQKYESLDRVRMNELIGAVKAETRVYF
jgi:hypothetical protein